MRKIIKIATMLLLFTLGVNVSTYADTLQTQSDGETPIFTEETQVQIDLIKELVNNNGIKFQNDKYIIMYKSSAIKKLSKTQLADLEESIKIFNEGISLGILEKSNLNELVPSTKYLNNTLNPLLNNDNLITIQAEALDLDALLKQNGGTMLRVGYINQQTYGAAGLIETGKYFASQVRSFGPWDYKQLGRSFTCTVNYKTMTISAEAIGNANYGFAGRKVFGAGLLRSAAGAYQIYSGTSYIGWYNSYFDDPNDQYWINRGISYSEGGSF